MSVPFFLTIDTEGDNIWDRPNIIKSTNVEKLYKFQELCNKYNIKPIYLTNYEASINKEFQRFAEINRRNLEIGLHLHAWNSPHSYNLTGNDYKYQPYLHEYPNEIIKNKIDYMMKNLENTFQTNIISHRGGRYSIDNSILKILHDYGIKIDCSVVPGYDWTSSLGNPQGNGGPDFRLSTRNKYYIYKDILEIPVSTFTVSKYLNKISEKNLARRVFSKLFSYKNLMLRSKVNNLDELKKVVEWNLLNQCTHLDYIIHSSELTHGTSHLLKNEEDEKIFYDNLEIFFMYLSNKKIESMTFKEYIS